MSTETINLLEWVFAFSYTIALVALISGFLYYRRNGKKTFFFTFVLVAAVVFQLCIMLVRIPMELGFAIGLFAIFGIIRYRTSPINPREMTYLLVAAGIAAKNALGVDFFDYYRLVGADAFMVVLIVLLEFLLFKTGAKVKLIIYKKLDLIHEDLRPHLIKDLQETYGFKQIDKVQVGKIDTVKQQAQLKVFFHDPLDHNFSDDDSD